MISEIHLKPGDVVVQQGTNHAWVNNSGRPCRIAFVLIDAQDPARMAAGLEGAVLIHRATR